MTTHTFNPRTILIILFMLVVACLRVILNRQTGFSILSNFTPIGTMALFGGAYFNKSWKAYSFPLLTLWLSDVILSRYVFYHQWRFMYGGALWVYGAFMLMVIFGRYILKNISLKNILLSSFAITFIHWIVSDMGVWLGGALYPKTINGWQACLIAAIPFEINFLSGTIIYTAIMFGSFEFMKAKYPSLKLA